MTIQITKQSDDFSTAPQISVDDVPEIAKLGFKTIINNRPDYEGGESQPTSAQLYKCAIKSCHWATWAGLSLYSGGT